MSKLMSMINHWLDRNRTTLLGKHACDDEMLKEMDVLEPKGHLGNGRQETRTNDNRHKEKTGWGIEWSNELADELHKTIWKKFKKKSVCFRYRCNMDC